MSIIFVNKVLLTFSWSCAFAMLAAGSAAQSITLAQLQSTTIFAATQHGTIVASICNCHANGALQQRYIFISLCSAIGTPLAMLRCTIDCMQELCQLKT
jgi:hypothetical protein